LKGGNGGGGSDKVQSNQKGEGSKRHGYTKFLKEENGAQRRSAGKLGDMAFN